MVLTRTLRVTTRGTRTLVDGVSVQWLGKDIATHEGVLRNYSAEGLTLYIWERNEHLRIPASVIVKVEDI